LKPQKRTEDLVIEAVLDEIVVADMARDKVHHLNEMAAFVWQQCDGEKTPEQIAALVLMKFHTDQAEELVWMSLDRLDKAHLLAERMAQDDQVLTRREMLKLATRVGISAAILPVVATITAPTAAAQASLFRTQLIGTGSGSNFSNCANFCGSQNCTGSASGSCSGTGGTRTCDCCCTGCVTGPNNC
jgi:hypothetical protein